MAAATLTYFGPNIARSLGMSASDLRAELGGSAFVSSVMSTPLGATAVVTLPMTFLDMVRDRPLTLAYAQEALDRVRAMGANHVSLSGLLASVLDYGSLLEAPVGLLTTGHATTGASILKTISAILTRFGRSWMTETVAVLGVGSIGQTVASAALAAFGLPHRLILSDLPVKRIETDAFVVELSAAHPGLDVVVCDSSQANDNRMYGASLVIGSTSTPNVLEPELLRPGCLVVDDSVPHCFHLGRAFTRAAAAGDVVFANGGVVRFPVAFTTTSDAPVLLHKLGWPPGIYYGSEITSCILSPVLMSQYSGLPATVGKRAPVAAVSLFTDAMDASSIVAPPIRCRGRSPNRLYLEQFTARFGGN